MTTLIFRPEAEADLAGIALFIAESHPERALRLIGRLRARCDILRKHPLAGRARDDLGKDLRVLIERPYVVVYRVIADSAEIIAFLHGARDLPASLSMRDKDKPE